MKIDYGQLEFIHPTLRALLSYVEGRAGCELTITSLYRPNDSGVHGTIPVRGCDLRFRYRSFAEEVADDINAEWIYDPDRPNLRCAIPHGDGFNFHLHLQVSDATNKLP